MRKKIMLLIILLVSTFSFRGVEAKVTDVSIKNIELVDITGEAQEVNEASFSGMNIKYNVVFRQPNDSVTYKVTLQNKGEEDIYINNKGEIGGSEYVIYDYNWDNNENIIRGNSEKIFAISIKYNKEVSAALLSQGSYVEAKNLVIKISDQKGNSLPVKNPKTDSNLSIFIILLSIEILTVMAVTIYLIKNKKLNIKNIKKMKESNMIAAGVFLVLVLGTIIGYSYALEVAEIKLDSKIKISKSRLARSCYSDSYARDHYDELKNYYGTPLTLNSSEIKTTTKSIEEDYCLDWNEVIYGNMPEEMLISAYDGDDDRGDDGDDNEGDENFGPIFYLTTKTTKSMPETYTWYDMNYELLFTDDVSDKQDGNVILGVYQNDEGEYLLVIGQDGGVLAPIDSSWLFGNYVNMIHSAPPQEGSEEETSLYNAISAQSDYETSWYDEFVFKEEKHILYAVKNVVMNPMAFMNFMELNNLDMSDTNNVSGMFAQVGAYSEYSELTGLKNWDTSSFEDMSGLFYYIGNINIATVVDSLSHFDTSNVKDMSGTFLGASLYFEEGDISNWNTSKVEDMSGMFLYGMNYTDTFDISNWDVSNVKNMRAMFDAGLNYVEHLDLSKWDVSNVENMSLMFTYGLNYVTDFDITNWNTSKVKDMSYMFADSLYGINELDLSRWDVSKVENFEGMFGEALGSATKLNLSNWNIASATNITDMFNYAFPYSDDVDLYLNGINFSKFETRTNANDQVGFIFYNTPYYLNVHVNSEEEQNWILGLDTYRRPYTWSKDNVTID